MADIVVLNRWRSEHAPKPQINLREPRDVGQILLFTGVRYERYGDWADRKAENHAVRPHERA